MVRISAALSVSQAQDYYENVYGNPVFLRPDDGQAWRGAGGEWFGRLAAEWQLVGSVTGEQFYRLIEGRHPFTGQRLVRPVDRYVNGSLRQVEPGEHRAGWEVLFTPPRPVSRLIAINCDPELKRAVWRAHIESVREALRIMEISAGALNDDGCWERSGSFIVSLHHHELARRDEEAGAARPEIRSHAVIMNMTRGQDGEIRAMQEREFLRHQALLTALYRTRISARVRRLCPIPSILPIPEDGERRERGRARIFKRSVTRTRSFETPRHTQRLVRVKRSSPCPVCHKPDWCSVSADGGLAICMRVASGYEAKNGGHVHLLDADAQRRERRTVTVQVNQYRRADIERRHQMHQELLSGLILQERDLRNLLDRGLDLWAIEQNDYRSVPLPSALGEVMARFRGRDLSGIPGFYREAGRWRLNIGEWRDRVGIAHSFHQGILIPVRNLQGLIEAFQIRRAEVQPDQPRYLWLSSSGREEGCSSGAPIHYRNMEQARRTGQALITEGALKGDVAAHLLGGRSAVIAGAGVWSFPQDFGPRLREHLPELRRVVIAFDADARRKPEVLQALVRLRESLRAGRFEVHQLHWREEEGKGLDDFLLRDPAHRAEVRDFLDW
ncbi:MAG TPA: relaxase domain-containing protein [Blastocatellia bacterium]|nr:relaxase domain-containing protein [Blastocatellia bacterium]